MNGPDLSHQRVKGELNATNDSQVPWARRCRSAILGSADAVTFAFGLLIGLGVCAPLLGGRRVFLLDWSMGSHLAVVTPTVLGLNGGLTTGIGGPVVVALLGHVFGGAVTWIPILAFFPVAMVGAGRLAGHSNWSRLSAGTLYAVNPFVFNRLYVGHLPLLIGYALLPFAVASAMRSPSSPISRWAATALWWAALTLLSPHFAWIFGVAVLGVFVVALATKECSTRRVFAWFAASVGAFALMSAYIILPASATELPTRVGSVSLAVYRTTGDPHLGLFANVLSLYGFWRTGPGPELPKDVIIGWPFLMFAILLLVAVGVWHALGKDNAGVSKRVRGPADDIEGTRARDHRDYRSEYLKLGELRDKQRRLTWVLLFAGTSSLFLALGNQGPTGGLFLWAYDHVPFFAVMREPQKFLMLLALAYAVFFGWGVERFTRIDVNPRRVGVVAATLLVGFALPLGYTATIFDGLSGQIGASAVPTAYQRANIIMGDGAGNILYLPWHLYMEYPFTNGRVVNNLGPTSFSRSVISGDDVQVDDVETQSTSLRSAYLQRLYSDGSQLTEFGDLVAPLGVKYVVLAKTVDWAAYGWLHHQKDLKLVLNDSSLEVWRNEAYHGVGQRVAKLRTVPSFQSLLALANNGELGSGAVVIRRGLKRASRVSATPHSVRQLSLVAYRIGPGTPGWVAVDAAYQRGWSLDGRPAIQSAEGTVLVRVGSEGGVLEFTPWGLVRLGYLESGGVFVCLAALTLAYRRRRASADDTDERI
jgi:hypothetical protein